MNPEAYGLIKQKPAEQLSGTFTSYDMAKTFTEGQNYVIAHPEKFGLCKPAEWGEEDEKMLEIAEECATNKDFVFETTEEQLSFLDWLNSLPKRFELQPKQEWSEEDEDMLNSCISSIEEAKENRYAYKETDGDTSYDHEIAWLKSLRNRVGKEFLQPHWKPSEEEVRLIKTSISFLKDFADKGYENAVECIDWLKSKLNGDACK